MMPNWKEGIAPKSYDKGQSAVSHAINKKVACVRRKHGNLAATEESPTGAGPHLKMEASN